MTFKIATVALTFATAITTSAPAATYAFQLTTDEHTAESHEIELCSSLTTPAVPHDDGSHLLPETFSTINIYATLAESLKNPGNLVELFSGFEISKISWLHMGPDPLTGESPFLSEVSPQWETEENVKELDATVTKEDIQIVFLNLGIDFVR